MEAIFDKRAMLLKLVAITLVFVSVGCSSMKPQDFEGKTPTLIPEQYFTGAHHGVGVFYDRFNQLRTSFAIDLTGDWDEPTQTLTLKEDLRYESGEQLQREYIITKKTPHLYSVQTADIEGEGTIEVYGNTMKWTYYLKQKIGDSVWVLYFDDWMHLQSDGTILNRAYAQKFGFDIGEVFMSVRKK